MSDSRPPGSDGMRRFYRWLLGLYPAAFRARYRDDLLQVFDDRRREPRFAGTLGGVRLVFFLLRDFMTSVPLAQTPGRRPRVGMTMNNIWHDLRYSFRMLGKNPMFTAAAVLTLALGIGLNAATFSTVDAILLKPLPGAREPERLVQLYRSWPGMEYGSNSIPHFQDMRDRSGDLFESVAAWYFSTMSLATDDQSERIMGLLVSANFFQTYGATPVLGRAFIPGEEDRGPGAHPVVVLGHSFWKSRFGSDPSVVGRTLTLNGQPYEVVGVAPPEFRSPMVLADVPVYVPLMMQMQIDPGRNLIESRGNNMMNVEARLRDGITLERAREGVTSLLAQFREDMPGQYDTQVAFRMVPQNEAGIHPTMRGAQVGMSAVMMAVVSLLLLIACVNVANLFLARARERRREMGIRLSLGAGRRRIVQQLLTESLVFSALAGAAGLGLASVAVKLLVNFKPPIDGPWYFAVEMDNRVLLFTLFVSLAAAVLFGLAPALQATKPDTVAAVKGDSGGSGSRSRTVSALVVVQMALSILLLISSGLFLRSLQGATQIDPGFDDPAHLVMASVDPGLQGYDEVRSKAFFDRLLEDLRALPEVRDVAAGGWVPLGLENSDQSMSIPGYEFAEGERHSINFAVVSERYLETLGVNLLEGRTFTRQDDEAAAPAIIVNKRFADHYWPGESALGKVVHTAGDDRQVIGVVESGKYRSLGEQPTDFMYLPWRELFSTEMYLVARTNDDPSTVLRRVQEIVRAADPLMPVSDLRTMENHMAFALTPARIGGSVLGIFGLLGLVLAAVGVYGVMAYSVAQRARELGIRVALGADRDGVLKLVLGEGMRLTAIGTVLGLLAAAAAAQALKRMLYNVNPLDPVAFTLVPAVLVGVAALAVYVPARRAARVDPIRALKTE